MFHLIFRRPVLFVCFVVLAAMAPIVAPALALPEGRVYELVTPPYKGGYAAKSIEAVAPDGESVAAISPGGRGAILVGGRDQDV